MFGELERPAVLVLGLGESGLALARWCLRHGCAVRIADTRLQPPNLSALDGLTAAARPEFIGGAFSSALLDGLDTERGGVRIVAISPGLSPYADDVASLLAEARARGAQVWGELEFFAQALRALGSAVGYRPSVLAITGTNGKTTTTALTAMLCERGGRRTAMAGNISPSLLDRLCAALDADALPQVWVLELSSFQLETAYSFAPDAAAVLNVTQDHLDWHGGFDAYRSAKARIFGAHSVRVLNRDDASSLAMLPGETAQHHAHSISFGLGAPERAGDLGLLRANGVDWIVEAFDPEDDAPAVPLRAETPAPKRRRSRVSASHTELMLRRLMPVDALRIRGLHNAANAMAALALCRVAGLPLAPLLHGLRDYRGEPHRVDHLATIADIEYVDDSKGTNVGATVAALQGLSVGHGKIVLIAGGQGKGQDFTPLAAAVTRAARAVVLIGSDAALLRAALADTAVPLADCDSLEAATRRAAGFAEPGDTVLLSPACASFDMFKNYAHRAEVFRRAVEQMAAEAGIVL
ncbi:MAG: UDP-N-acetylmuramoyl-L-alanine--D-glutamate ligase [Janthinobacterium lividum]